MNFLDRVLRTRSHLRNDWGKRWDRLQGVRDYQQIAILLGLYYPTVLAAAAQADSWGYIPHIIPKRRGGDRLLLEPMEPLKSVQQAITRWLDSACPSHPAAQGFVKERSILTNARVHVGAAFVACFDLRDFFPSTTHLHLDDAFEVKLPSIDMSVRAGLIHLATVPHPSILKGYQRTNLQLALRLLAPYLYCVETESLDALTAVTDGVRASTSLRGFSIARNVIDSIEMLTVLAYRVKHRLVRQTAFALRESDWENLPEWWPFLLGEQLRKPFRKWPPQATTGFHRALQRLDLAFPMSISQKYLEVLRYELHRKFPTVSPPPLLYREGRVAWPSIHSTPIHFTEKHAWKGADAMPESLSWRSLPQGSPCSPALSNLAAHGLDEDCAAYANANGLRYTRYADDLTFSGEQMPKRLTADIARIVEARGHRIAREKTRLRGPGHRRLVTGIVVNEVLRPSHLPARTLRAVLHHLDCGKPAKIPVQGSTPLPATESRVLGHLAYWKMIAPNVYAKLVNRSCWAKARVK